MRKTFSLPLIAIGVYCVIGASTSYAETKINDVAESSSEINYDNLVVFPENVEMSFPEGFKIFSDEGKLIKEVPGPTSAIVRASSDIKPFTKGQSYLSDWSYERLGKYPKPNWIVSKSPPQLSKGDEDTSKNTNVQSKDSTLQVFPMNMEINFPDGYKVFSDDGKLIKEESGPVTATVRARSDGRAFTKTPAYLSDWSYDRMKKGQKPNWVVSNVKSQEPESYKSSEPEDIASDAVISKILADSPVKSIIVNLVELTKAISSDHTPIDTLWNDINSLDHFEHIKRVADSGDSSAAAVVSTKYAFGINVEQNSQLSLKYALLSAQKGHPLGIYRLGVARLAGDGIQKNEIQGIELIRKSINGLLEWGQGEMPSCCAIEALGEICSQANIVTEDKTEAARLYKTAADMGHEPAAFNYAMCLDTGTGVSRNIEERNRYLGLAGRFFEPAFRWRESRALSNEELWSENLKSIKATHYPLKAEEMNELIRDLNLDREKYMAFYKNLLLQNKAAEPEIVHHSIPLSWDHFAFTKEYSFVLNGHDIYIYDNATRLLIQKSSYITRGTCIRMTFDSQSKEVILEYVAKSYFHSFVTIPIGTDKFFVSEGIPLHAGKVGMVIIDDDAQYCIATTPIYPEKDTVSDGLKFEINSSWNPRDEDAAFKKSWLATAPNDKINHAFNFLDATSGNLDLISTDSTGTRIERCDLLSCTVKDVSAVEKSDFFPITVQSGLENMYNPATLASWQSYISQSTADANDTEKAICALNLLNHTAPIVIGSYIDDFLQKDVYYIKSLDLLFLDTRDTRNIDNAREPVRFLWTMSNHTLLAAHQLADQKRVEKLPYTYTDGLAGTAGSEAVLGKSNSNKTFLLAAENSVEERAVDSAKVVNVFKGVRILGSPAMSYDRRFIYGASRDYSYAIEIWNAQTCLRIGRVFRSSNSTLFIVLDDSYYMGTEARGALAFRVGYRAFPFEQFDLRLNRPDIVLYRLGAPPEAITIAKELREKRLKRMSVTEDMLKPDFHLPEIQFAKELPISTDSRDLRLEIRATDSKYPLERLRVYVNDVPVNGKDGEALRSLNSQSLDRTIPVNLSAGKNKIQVSVLNSAGAESLYATAEVNCTTSAAKPNLYVVAMGVSNYGNQQFNLKYAAKDAGDLASKLKSRAGNAYAEVKELLLKDGEVTKDSLAKVREFLKPATVDDSVVLFMAGHGLLDDKYDYYFGTSDMDFNIPAGRGIAFDDMDDILAELPSRKKSLLMDTCHAGELDADEKKVLAAADAAASGTPIQLASNQSVAVRSVGTRGMALKGIEGAKGKSEWYERISGMFIDLRRGSGSTILSSSAGAEYAFESGEQKNGLFTYAVLEALDGKNDADADKDGKITVKELCESVKTRVQELSGGKQTPNTRRLNLESDFPLATAGPAEPIMSQPKSSSFVR